MDDAPGQDRIWVSVYFRCCHVYQRIYFKKGACVTQGRCPRCLKEVEFELSENGEPGRFFSADLTE